MPELQVVLFNGFEANHITEALHRACIHPMMRASSVFQYKELLQRLLQGLYDVSCLPPS